MQKSAVNQTENPKLFGLAGLLAAFAMMIAGFALPAYAQEVETFDPDDAFGTAAPQSDPGFDTFDPVQPAGDEATTTPSPAPEQAPDVIRQPGYRTAPSLDPVTGQSAPADSPSVAQPSDGNFSNEYPADSGVTAYAPDAPAQNQAAQDSGTYGQDDLIGAAEGVFGKGAQGLAKMIENLLRDQGEPNGYIVGREAGGAFVFGARYGSGTLHHKIEGQRKVYWRGPSLGLDAGANAANTFVLVYNLYDSEDLFRRYGAGEGQAYLIGGLHASYMRRGDVVLIPIRVGAGLRLGVNAGYMKFSEKQNWLPF